MEPVTYTGDGYAQYTLLDSGIVAEQQQVAKEMAFYEERISMRIQTNAEEGLIFRISGVNDFAILQVTIYSNKLQFSNICAQIFSCMQKSCHEIFFYSQKAFKARNMNYTVAMLFPTFCKLIFKVQVLSPMIIIFKPNFKVLIFDDKVKFAKTLKFLYSVP